MFWTHGCFPPEFAKPKKRKHQQRLLRCQGIDSSCKSEEGVENLLLFQRRGIDFSGKRIGCLRGGGIRVGGGARTKEQRRVRDST